MQEKSNNLKWSRFNFIIENNKGFFLYNSYSNCLLNLSPEINALCCRLRDGLCHYEDFLSDEEYKYFRDNYILVEEDDDLVETLHMHSMARLYSNKSFVLTIAPTHNCNYACSYCYEHHRTSKPMNDSTGQAIVDYVKHLKEENGLEVLYITWYGGEPLLQIERVCSLSKKLCELGVNVQENSIITNGYFLTKETLEKLKCSGINEIQITLDGDKQTHDTRRPLLNGGGSYDTIIRNLDSFFTNDYDKHFTLVVRVNIDKENFESYAWTYNWLKTRYKSYDFIVYPGVIVINEDDSCSRNCMARNEVTDMFLDLYKKYKIISERLYPDDINIECKARSPYGSMLIGSQGEIYKCFEDLGKKDKIVGNINNHNKWSNYKELARLATGIDHYTLRECKECPYLPICNGGCPIRRYENEYLGKHNDCCTPFKGRIEEYISLVLEQ